VLNAKEMEHVPGMYINLIEDNCHTCDVYVHLVKLTFWQNSKPQFMLINRIFLGKRTSSDMFCHDFRNWLVLVKPCISQRTGLVERR